MQLKINKFLFDILTSINSINDYLGESPSFIEYQENKLLRRAVEREIEIIGEAVNGILNINPNYEITNARRIVDTRNWVIHAYDSVDNTIIWTIVSRHLPLLKAEVEKLIQE
jgi:uncharacterized protein with HEPN domain